VLIVDDVITAGTAIREAVDQLRYAGAIIVGVVVCLDRQERCSDSSRLSAVQVLNRLVLGSVPFLSSLIQLLF
jgi:orotate phosphoribosyltransferase